MPPLLTLNGVSKSWRRVPWQAPRVALHDVNLQVYPGEVVGLIGESGGGKTTLAKIALGLIPRDAGTVQVLGQDPATLLGAAEHSLRKNAQLLLQDASAALNPGLRVRESVAEALRVHGATAEKGREALSRVGLLGREEAFPAELSGGEKRRVTLAQLWIARPRLVIADEPTAGLDASRKAELLDLLLADRGPDRGFLLVSHDLPLVLYACSRVLVLADGRIVDNFATPDVHGEGRSSVTRSLLDGAGLAAPR